MASPVVACVPVAASSVRDGADVAEVCVRLSLLVLVVVVELLDDEVELLDDALVLLDVDVLVAFAVVDVAGPGLASS